MYKICFKDKEGNAVVVGQFKDVESACSFALAFHRSSNVPHFIEVYFNGDKVITFDSLPVKSDA